MTKKLANILTIAAFLLLTVSGVYAQDMSNPSFLRSSFATKITQPTLTPAEAHAFFIKGANAIRMDISSFSTGSNVAIDQNQDFNNEGVRDQADINSGVVRSTSESQSFKSESQMGDHDTSVANEDINRSSDINSESNINENSSNTVRQDFTLQPLPPDNSQQSLDLNKDTSSRSKSKRVRLAKD